MSFAKFRKLNENGFSKQKKHENPLSETYRDPERVKVREVLMKSARAVSERFYDQSRYRRVDGKDPLTAADDLFRGSLDMLCRQGLSNAVAAFLGVFQIFSGVLREQDIRQVHLGDPGRDGSALQGVFIGAALQHNVRQSCA